MTKKNHPSDIHTAVRDHYGEIAEKSQPGCGCSSTQTPCCGTENDIQLDIGKHLYQDINITELPAEVTDISLGCGDPVTLASLKEGQTVLDLGSGGGIDCFLAAKRVGSSGSVIGVDMTPAMVERAQANKTSLGTDNVEFRLGEIENLPVEDGIVDVIISNCVINLSPDKPTVFREAFRVLKPGGKIAVSDIVTDGDLPDSIKNSLSAWAGCVAGALDVEEYVAVIQEAGFVDVDVKASYWDPEIIDAAIKQLSPDLQAQVKENKENGRKTLLINDDKGMKIIEGYDADNFDPQKSIFSAKITAWKPM
jgi:SAM-dependent methyltransferase